MGFVFLRKLLKNWKRKSKCFWCMALCWNPFLSHQAEQQTGTHPSTQVLIQNDFLLPWHLRILQLSEGQLWVLCSDSIFHTPFSIFHIPYPTWRQDNHLFAKWSSHTLRSVQTPVALFLSWASPSHTPGILPLALVPSDLSFQKHTWSPGMCQRIEVISSDEKWGQVPHYFCKTNNPLRWFLNGAERAQVPGPRGSSLTLQVRCSCGY